MAERRNTVVSNFDPVGPRITALEILEWMHDVLRIPEQTVQMIQIDGTTRQLYIKTTDNERVPDLI
jgi:hypothetical protein